MHEMHLNLVSLFIIFVNEIIHGHWFFFFFFQNKEKGRDVGKRCISRLVLP